MSLFQKAGAVEILRSVQKDEVIKQKIEESLSNIILKLFGPRKWLQYKNSISSLTSLIYYGSTTLCGYQTLGEEYTGIIQVDSTLKYLPSFQRRLLMVLFDSFGYYFIMKYIKAFENGPLLLAFLQGIHRDLFYWQHTYYNFPKRLTNIKYILMRSWLKNKDNISIFRIISLIALITSILNSIKTAYEFSEHQSETITTTSLSENQKTLTNKNKCTLCLEDYKNISVTRCGHLFCWNCILVCLQNKNQCPICREEVYPNQVILLQKYQL